MTRYAEHVTHTDQRVKARPDQVKNNAGGFVFALDKWARLDRFLILGAEGGTYYVDEPKLALDNAASLQECIASDGPRTVARIVEISVAGRAPKNDPAIFALALCCASPDPKTRTASYAAVPQVCRIGTHLFHFAEDVGKLRGYSRGLRSALARWYLERDIEGLAYQVVKYQSRDKWTHRDVLRLAHPTTNEPGRSAVLRWVVDRAGLALDKPKGKGHSREELPALIVAFEAIHTPGVTIKAAAALIAEQGLPHECVPNEMKSSPEIWEALLASMPMTAMIRNLGKMTEVGLLKPLSEAARLVRNQLESVVLLQKARVHPLAVLLALSTYRAGHGVKGGLTWNPVGPITDALDEAFYLAFSAVTPTGKARLIALDVSGSMGATINGTHLSCRAASSALALVTARTEKQWHLVAFTGDNTLSPLKLGAKTRLDQMVAATDGLPFGRTDCALPMLYAAGEKLDVDAFEIYTDNETWAGGVHPFQALRDYREFSGKPAKLVVAGMTSTGFTVADPNDAGMLDVVGFDASAPAVMSDFIGDRLTRPAAAE